MEVHQLQSLEVIDVPVVLVVQVPQVQVEVETAQIPQLPFAEKTVMIPEIQTVQGPQTSACRTSDFTPSLTIFAALTARD